MYRDTRAIDHRIEELEELEEILDEAREEYLHLVEYAPGATQSEIDAANERYLDAVQDFSVEESEELEALRNFKKELEGYCDWDHGETLIHEHEKVDYVYATAIDIGALGDNADWIKIDWEATAEEFLLYDYTSADLNGETYYVRCS